MPSLNLPQGYNGTAGATPFINCTLELKVQYSAQSNIVHGTFSKSDSLHLLRSLSKFNGNNTICTSSKIVLRTQNYATSQSNYHA